MKKSVLIIDDENDLCDLFARVLNKQRFLVSCAHTLAEASELQICFRFVRFLC
jgi:DNA-binding response OmpR family regulator